MSEHNISHLLVSITSQENLEIRRQLEREINYLLVNDFNALISILYRVDVNEQVLKKMLQKNNGKDAAVIITNMLISRQVEKLKTKNQFKAGPDIPDDEKW